VSVDPHGDVVLESVVQGDTVREVLEYVQYNSQTLLDQFRKDVETAVREQRMGYEESGRLLKFYEEGLQGYTYLEQ
jgi:arginine decarboxylase